MATLVKYTTHESEVRILYEYLAEASVVFPKVFPVIHSLLDAKITNVLSLCHDKTILAAVQSIIENMIACEDEKSQQQLHFLQVSDYFCDMYSSDIVRGPQYFFEILKGQIKSEWIYEIINFPKNDQKDFKDFYPMYCKNSHPLLISSGFLKYPLELKKKFS